MQKTARDLAQFTPEAKFRKTGDIRYAALAVGENPNDPPQWAIEACTKFADDDYISIAPLGRKPVGKYDHDSDLLSQVAELYVRGRCLHGACVEALGGKYKAHSSDIKRLENVWNRASWTSQRISKNGKKLQKNRWTLAAHQRLVHEAISRASCQKTLAFDIAFPRELERLRLRP